MKNIGRKLGITGLIVAGVIGVAGIVNHMTGIGLRLNISHSAPVGIWGVTPFDAAKLERGQLVEVCPPAQPIVRLMADRGYLEQGSCEGTNVAPFLKGIGAIPGDSVTIRQGQVVSVNGASLPNTASIPTLPGWPNGTYIVAPGHVWLFSTYAASSFDSRYFGPVALANVRGRATPILINGNPADISRFGEQ